jgi:hypothetical protein
MTALVGSKSLHSIWESNLKDLNVKLPKEGSWARKSLEYLYENIGTWKHKTDIIKGIGYNKTDLQPRHLNKQYGWYVEQDGKANYKLVSVTEVWPQWIPNKRTTIISAVDFDELKEKYNYQCASCGCKEGEPHRYNAGEIVKLERGHKDPDLDLKLDNMIPQCGYCNKRYKNRFKFDNYGMIIAVRVDADTGWRKP